MSGWLGTEKHPAKGEATPQSPFLDSTGSTIGRGFPATLSLPKHPQGAEIFVRHPSAAHVGHLCKLQPGTNGWTDRTLAGLRVTGSGPRFMSRQDTHLSKQTLSYSLPSARRISRPKQGCSLSLSYLEGEDNVQESSRQPQIPELAERSLAQQS